MGGRTEAEAGGEVVRDAGCGEDGVADDEEESEGADIVVEGIEAGGGGGAVDRDEEGEEDEMLNAAEGDEGHGCVGEGVDFADDGTGGLRDVVGDGIASGLGVEEMMGTACALGVVEVMGTACALGVVEVMGTACALGVVEVTGDLVVTMETGTACALGVDLGAAAAVAPASVVDWGTAAALGAVLTAAFAPAILGAAWATKGLWLTAVDLLAEFTKGRGAFFCSFFCLRSCALLKGPLWAGTGVKLAESLLEVTADVVAALAAKAFCLLTMACCFSAALLARSVTGNALMRAQSACAVLPPFLQSKKHDCHNTRAGLSNDSDASSKVMKLLKKQAQFAARSEFGNKHEFRSPGPNWKGKRWQDKSFVHGEWRSLQSDLLRPGIWSPWTCMMQTNSRQHADLQRLRLKDTHATIPLQTISKCSQNVRQVNALASLQDGMW